MGLIKTAIKTAVAVKTAHVVHDRIDRRKQQEWVAQGHSPESYPGTPLGGAVGAALGLPPAGPANAAAVARSVPAAAVPPTAHPVPSEDPVSSEDAAAPSPSSATVSDTLAQLRELGELRTAGILTDDEFEAQKRRILGG